MDVVVERGMPCYVLIGGRRVPAIVLDWWVKHNGSLEVKIEVYMRNTDGTVSRSTYPKPIQSSRLRKREYNSENEYKQELENYHQSCLAVMEAARESCHNPQADCRLIDAIAAMIRTRSFFCERHIALSFSQNGVNLLKPHRI